MPPTARARLPLEPLARFFRGHENARRQDQWVRRLADRVGIDPANVRKVQERGLSPSMADKWATRCGLVPAIVWGEDWETPPLPIFTRLRLARLAWLVKEPRRRRVRAAVKRKRGH